MGQSAGRATRMPSRIRLRSADGSAETYARPMEVVAMGIREPMSMTNAAAFQ